MSSFAVVLRNVADTLPARGSMRSRGAAAISTVTLRPISAVLPPERAWGLWASRRIVSGVMDTLGPSLAGTQVEHVDVRMPRWRQAHRRMGPRSGRASRKPRDLLRPRQRIRAVLAPHSPPTDRMAVGADRAARFRRRLSAYAPSSIPRRRNGCADRLGLADRPARLDPGAGGHRRRLGGRPSGRRHVASLRRRPPGRDGPDVAAHRPLLRAVARPRSTAA